MTIKVTPINELALTLCSEYPDDGTYEKVKELLACQKLIVAKSEFSWEMYSTLSKELYEKVKARGYRIDPNIFCRVTHHDAVNLMSGEKYDYYDPRCQATHVHITRLNKATRLFVKTVNGYHVMSNIPRPIDIDVALATSDPARFFRRQNTTVLQESNEIQLRVFDLEPLRAQPRPERQPAQNPIINRLPTEHTLSILSFLSHAAIASLRRVDRTFHRLAKDPWTLANILCEQDPSCGDREHIYKLLDAEEVYVGRGTAIAKHEPISDEQRTTLTGAGVMVPKQTAFHFIENDQIHNFMSGQAAPPNLANLQLPVMIPAPLKPGTVVMERQGPLCRPALFFFQYRLLDIPVTLGHSRLRALNATTVEEIRELFYIDALPRVEAPKKEEGKRDGPST